MFSVDHGPCLMATVPLADGLGDGRCLNGPHDHDPTESRCDAPTRICGASMRRSIGIVCSHHQPRDPRPHAPSTKATAGSIERHEPTALPVLTCIPQ
jgi:hypothetical protein